MLKQLSPFFVSCVLAVCLAGCAVTAPSNVSPVAEAANAPPDEKLFDDNNVLILLSSEQEANELTINVSRRGYQLIDRQYLAGLNKILLDFARPPGISDEVAVNDMQMMSPSAEVGLDSFYIAQTEERSFVSFRGREYANALLGWPDHGCRAMTSIGIIDGYLSSDMTGLNASQIVSHNFARQKSVKSDHAETVVSLISGPGRLKDVKIYSAGVIGVSDAGLEGSGTKELVLAFDWLWRQNVRIVNVSLAGPYNPLLESVVTALADKGMVIVAAVGNEGPDADPRYPAAFDPVIAVTAIDAEQKVFRLAVQGAHVDYAAPGVDLLIQAGEETGRYVSGTSFAAPFVTALIAADTSKSFEGDANAVRSFLNRNTFDLGATGPDPVFGRGLVRASDMCLSNYTMMTNGAPS